ncbi:hypothetical protein SAMN04487843_101337 [Methylobacterium sp. ap11]|uniref:hypothetical protein n=1 Tax=Methylobacterium sp. ap11 TaxID=1761799 RepID=UPI0008C5CEDC|nr:hypothetical protein [Methylobacterium sp. ap11]SEO42192.1 hypothetical protein SAMN04487843_101337 [Methylobacterium sp. ap11]
MDIPVMLAASACGNGVRRLNTPAATTLSALWAMTLAPVVALLLRTAWVEGVDRFGTLFRDRPPTLFASFVERVATAKGWWDPKASTAMSYAWFVWVRGRDPLPVFWIPPGCRQGPNHTSDVARFGARTAAPLFSAAE